MTHPKEAPYQVTNKDVADAEANMTEAKWDSTESRARRMQEMDALLAERRMSREDIERCDLKISGSGKDRHLEGVMTGKDGTKSRVVVDYYSTGPLVNGIKSFVLNETILDRSALETTGLDFLNRWVPIVELMKASLDQMKRVDEGVKQEQNSFEYGEREKARKAEVQRQRDMIENLF